MRVLLATDQEELSAALRIFLGERLIDVVGVVSDLERVVARADASQPDVVIVDSRLRRALTSTLIHDLQTGCAAPSVVVLTTTQDQPLARAIGADGVAMLGDPPDCLLAALREAVAAR